MHVRCNIFMKLKNDASHLRRAHLCCPSTADKVCINSLQVFLVCISDVVVEFCMHSMQEILKAVEFYSTYSTVHIVLNSFSTGRNI